MLNTALIKPEVRIKKYFYMLRPILAAAWIEAKASVPPMEFAPLLAMLEGQQEIRALVDGLLERKQHTDERIPIQREPRLDSWLEAEMLRLKDSAGRLPAAKPDAAGLDPMFRGLLGLG